MRRILIFSLVYYPKHYGGAEVAIKEITDRIDPKEIEFHMVCLRFDSTLPKQENIGNVHIHRIGPTKPNPTTADLKKFPLHYNKHLFQFLAAWKALTLHRKFKFDAVWAVMAHSCGVPAAIFKMLHPRVPYILTLQEGDPPEHIERLARPVWPLFSRAFTSANTIQAISTFLGNWARRRGFKGRLEIIPNAVNTKHFSQAYADTDLAAFKQKLGKREGDVYVITTSRLVHKNAIDDVITALKSLPSHVHFLVLGIGPDEKKLKKVSKDCGVEDRVHFLGQIDHSEMPKYLKISDIFTRPSRSEGMGNSFVEAMAAGLPIIATQEGGIVDFLHDAKRNPEKPTTGWAVDKDNPQQIANAVQEILQNPEQVRTVVMNAKKLALEKYDWDLVARTMKEKVFLPVLSTRV